MLRHAEPIPLQFFPATPDDVDNGVTLEYGVGGTPADVGYFFIPFKCEVMEAGVLIRTGLAGGTIDAVVAFDRRFTPGSDTGRSAADVGQIYLGVTGASAAGDVVYDLVAQGNGVTLEPGMEVVVAVDTAIVTGTGSAGRVWPYLLVRHIPEVRGNLSKMQATT